MRCMVDCRSLMLSICVLLIATGFFGIDGVDKLNNALDNSVMKRIMRVIHAGSISCQDDPTTATMCPLWKNAEACRFHRIWMRQYCASTCDLCTPPAPPPPIVPDCAKTDFGCCWDNKTVAKGPVDDLALSQCPPCLDRQSRIFCNNWKSDCNSQIIGQGDVMRLRCPTTCNVPCDNNLNMNNKKKCQDEPAYKQACLQWFDERKCETDQEQMRLFCPFSCGYCHVGQVQGYNKL